MVARFLICPDAPDRMARASTAVLEVLAAAMAQAEGAPAIVKREQAQQWLRQQKYQPSVLHIGLGKRVGARLFVANATTTDHPAGEHPMFKAMAAANGRHHDDESLDEDTAGETPEGEGDEQVTAELVDGTDESTDGEFDVPDADESDDVSDEDEDEDEIDLDDEDLDVAHAPPGSPVPIRRTHSITPGFAGLGTRAVDQRSGLLQHPADGSLEILGTAKGGDGDPDRRARVHQAAAPMALARARRPS